MNSKLRACIATTTIACLAFVSVPPPAHAQVDARAQVREQLVAQGVTPANAEARARVLTDAEAQTLALDMEALPAGGFVGVIALTVIFLAAVAAAFGSEMNQRHRRWSPAPRYEPVGPPSGDFPTTYSPGCPRGRC